MSAETSEGHQLEIPETWERCEIHNLTQPLNPETIALDGVVIVETFEDRAVIKPRPDVDGSPSTQFPEIIREIKENLPEAEIIFF